MTNKEQFELCLKRSSLIVSVYRNQAPECFDPKNIWTTTATLVSLAVMSLVSAGVGAYGAQASASAQADAANYNAAVAKNNAASAAQQANFDAQQIRDRNKRLLAEQRNAFAANGFDPESGSAVDVRSDSSLQGEMQALMAIYTGRTSANASDAQAKLFRMNAGNAETAGYIGVASNLLGGATSALNVASNPNFRH